MKKRMKEEEIEKGDCGTAWFKSDKISKKKESKSQCPRMLTISFSALSHKNTWPKNVQPDHENVPA